MPRERYAQVNLGSSLSGTFRELELQRTRQARERAVELATPRSAAAPSGSRA
jgi:hypothetical protein